MRILDALRTASERLEQGGIDDHLADAEIICYHVAQLERLTAFLDNPEITPGTLRSIQRLTARRLKGEPVQYLVGAVEFWGLTIAVGSGVLIPRPETELLVEEAIRTVKKGDEDLPSSEAAGSPVAILDLCTGSGCIALALAKRFPEACVTGTDISGRALTYAKKNAAANHIFNAVFRKGHLFEPLKKTGRFDVITANPPYIRTGDLPGLQPEVREWEPENALDGGPDGLGFYREILLKAPDYLIPGGTIVFELGYDQAAEVKTLARAQGFNKIMITNDYAGIGRILSAAKSGHQEQDPVSN